MKTAFRGFRTLLNFSQGKDGGRRISNLLISAQSVVFKWCGVRIEVAWGIRNFPCLVAEMPCLGQT